MKKAFDLLNEKKIKYEFIDFKKQAISQDFIKKILESKSIESIINTKGTTFKKLAKPLDSITAEIICEYPTLLKRPLVIQSNNIYIGLGELEKIL